LDVANGAWIVALEGARPGPARPCANVDPNGARQGLH
jgi:hypothetical protein